MHMQICICKSKVIHATLKLHIYALCEKYLDTKQVTKISHMCGCTAEF